MELLSYLIEFDSELVNRMDERMPPRSFVAFFVSHFDFRLISNHALLLFTRSSIGSLSRASTTTTFPFALLVIVPGSEWPPHSSLQTSRPTVRSTCRASHTASRTYRTMARDPSSEIERPSRWTWTRHRNFRGREITPDSRWTQVRRYHQRRIRLG